jgi:hypothetical protein
VGFYLLFYNERIILSVIPIVHFGKVFQNLCFLFFGGGAGGGRGVGGGVVCNFKFPFLDCFLIFSNQNIQPIFKFTYSNLATYATKC